MMADQSNKPIGGPALRALLWAGVFETLCLVGGVFMFLRTDNVLWIVIGVLAGLGFSLPAVIRFFRERKEQDNASR